jgi:hypothetical protein
MSVSLGIVLGAAEGVVLLELPADALVVVTLVLTGVVFAGVVLTVEEAFVDEPVLTGAFVPPFPPQPVAISITSSNAQAAASILALFPLPFINMPFPNIVSF